MEENNEIYEETNELAPVDVVTSEIEVYDDETTREASLVEKGFVVGLIGLAGVGVYKGLTLGSKYIKQYIDDRKSYKEFKKAKQQNEANSEENSEKENEIESEDNK